MFKFVTRHKFLSFLVLSVLVVGGYYGYKKITTKPVQTRYVLGEVEKGSLIVSVSGTGQIAASDQMDVKAKVSGDVVSVSVVKDQKVKEGAVLVQLDARDARASVSDAEIALESARIKLEDLQGPSDPQILLQARNSLAQAQRDLEKAQDTYDTIGVDTEDTLAATYEDGYNQVSSSFYKLSDYMQDLRDVMGTDKSEDENIAAYKLILGSDSVYIRRLEEDYAAAKEAFDANYAAFRGIFSDADRGTIYELLADTLNTARPIYRALESARHMYDAIVVVSYSQYRIASTIDRLKPSIESDTSSVTSVISSLQQTIDKIDTTVADTPGKIKDAELTLRAAEEKVAEREQALADLEAGADPLDVRTQQNTVAQKEAALRDARQRLADTTVRAPFDGVVAAINVKKGDTVSSGAIATLITEQKLAEISLNEIDAAKVRIGQKATITVDAVSDLSITGEVADVDTVGTVSQGVVNYAVKIIFDTQDDRIKPGMSLSAAIITEARLDTLIVANSAVKSSSNGNYVEVLDDPVPAVNVGTNGSTSASYTSDAAPRQQAVQVGSSNDTMTEIVSGLNEGDRIVVSTIKPTATGAATQGTSIFGGIGGGARPSGAAGTNVMFRRD